MYHQQTKNLLVSYSPKKLGFFQSAPSAVDALEASTALPL